MTKIRIDSLTAIEIMEAYSAQAIIAANEFKFNREFINIGGGALARGHAIGASGAILAVRLFHELQKSRWKRISNYSCCWRTWKRTYII